MLSMKKKKHGRIIHEFKNEIKVKNCYHQKNNEGVLNKYCVSKRIIGILMLRKDEKQTDTSPKVYFKTIRKY